MKTCLKNFYLNKWYAPVLLAVVSCIICFFLVSIRCKYVLEISLLIPFLTVTVSLFLGFRRLLRKDYFDGALQLAGSLAVGFVGVYIGGIICFFYPYDFFGQSHTVPEGVKYNIPLEQGKTENSAINEITLYDGMQPGIYYYSVQVKNLPAGSLYLKAYEVTENIPLSAERLHYRSEIKVEKPIADTSVKLSLPEQKDFTIYEGDWGNPYLARFELWFKPDAGGKEKKLSEKIYKIEGWMR